jgi:hypothetical protein
MKTSHQILPTLQHRSCKVIPTSQYYSNKSNTNFIKPQSHKYCQHKDQSPNITNITTPQLQSNTKITILQ